MRRKFDANYMKLKTVLIEMEIRTRQTIISLNLTLQDMMDA